MEDTKRTRILDAATKVFAEKGYQYATIAEIAREAGMSTGLLYSYFTNKLDVLLSIIVIFLQTINRLNRETLAPLRDPFDKLYVFLQNCQSLLLNDKGALHLVKVLHEALPHIVIVKDEKLHEKRKEIMRANKELLVTIDDIMREGQSQGVFDDSLRPSVMRQVFSGAIERVIYGLYFKTYGGEEIGYDGDDGHKAIVRVIEKFIRKDSIAG